jgi:hypothetical protein
MRCCWRANVQCQYAAAVAFSCQRCRLLRVLAAAARRRSSSTRAYEQAGRRKRRPESYASRSHPRQPISLPPGLT